MSESPDARISILLKERSTAETGAELAPSKLATQQSPRRWLAALVVIVLSVAMWGAWNFVNSSSSRDDSDSIADLDGFESAPPFATTANDKTESGGLGASVPLLDAPGPIDIHSVFDDSRYSERSLAPADAWLTGTIEDAEQSDRIEIPRRISGGVSDSSIVR